MASKSPNPIGIVVPGPKASSTLASRLNVNRIPLPGLQPLAPAWFYSALNWLGAICVGIGVGVTLYLVLAFAAGPGA